MPFLYILRMSLTIVLGVIGSLLFSDGLELQAEVEQARRKLTTTGIATDTNVFSTAEDHCRFRYAMAGLCLLCATASFVVMDDRGRTDDTSTVYGPEKI